jgi:hypothetical protein
VIGRRPLVKSVLDEHRAAVKALVPRIEAARTANDEKAWDGLIDEAAGHGETMRAAYRKSAVDPTINARIVKAIDNMTGGGHDHRN